MVAICAVSDLVVHVIVLLLYFVHDGSDRVSWECVGLEGLEGLGVMLLDGVNHMDLLAD